MGGPRRCCRKTPKRSRLFNQRDPISSGGDPKNLCSRRGGILRPPKSFHSRRGGIPIREGGILKREGGIPRGDPRGGSQTEFLHEGTDLELLPCFVLNVIFQCNFMEHLVTISNKNWVEIERICRATRCLAFFAFLLFNSLRFALCMHRFNVHTRFHGNFAQKPPLPVHEIRAGNNTNFLNICAW